MRGPVSSQAGKLAVEWGGVVLSPLLVEARSSPEL